MVHIITLLQLCQFDAMLFSRHKFKFSSYLIKSLNTAMSSIYTQYLAGLTLAYFVTTIKIECIRIMPTPGVKLPRCAVYRAMGTSR